MTNSSTMDAIVIQRFGEPAVFEAARLAKPKVTSGHVLIKVEATSVNPVDCKIRQGALTAIAPTFPAVLHGDVSGIIEATGPGVETLKAGDEVYACGGGVRGSGGALAEYMLVDSALVALKPQTLTHHEAAALPLVSITAWTALIDKARLKPGQTVLIHGATGGVSHVAIQIAKAKGATVYATCSSTSKEKMAKALGADYAINYRDMTVNQYVEHFTAGKGFDVVFDTVGGDNIQTSFQATALNGTVVSVSTRSTQDLSFMHAKGLSLHVVFMLIPLLHEQPTSQQSSVTIKNGGRAHQGEILNHITALVNNADLRPLIDETQYRISEVAKAHSRLASGEATGKVVLIQS